MSARVWIALAIVYVVWGSTYLAIRVAIETMPPLLMGSVRFLAAGAILYAWGVRRRDRRRRALPRRQRRRRARRAHNRERRRRPHRRADAALDDAVRMDRVPGA